MPFKYSIAASPEHLTYAAPVPLRGSINDCASVAARLGYSALELHLTDPARYDASAIKRTLEENNLNLSAIATGMELSRGFCLIDSDNEKRQAAVSRICEHVDLASGLGSSVIIGCVRGNLSDTERVTGTGESLVRLQKSITAVVEYAIEHGVLVMLEAINYYVNNYLNTLAETAAFIRSIGSSALRLHADTHHMNISEIDLSAALRETADLLGYIHYSDSNRLYPGGGNIDFSAITKTLEDIDYCGYISMEITPFPDSETASHRAIEYAQLIEKSRN